jgi:uncharacterized membrane protein
MVRQVSNESAQHSVGYAITNALIWASYATMVVVVTGVFNFVAPVTVAAATLVVAVVLYPLRRSAGRWAKRRFRHH